MVDIIKCVSSSISHRKSFITYLWNLGPLSPPNPPPHSPQGSQHYMAHYSCILFLAIAAFNGAYDMKNIFW